MKKITITEALKELKLYDSRIDKALKNAQFVSCAKKASDMVKHKQKEAFEKDAKASYSSVTDLIANRAKIKGAIVKSNAETVIEVGGEKMTVAAAVERKTSIVYEKELLAVMKSQLAKASDEMQKGNAAVDRQCEAMAIQYLSGDKKEKPSAEAMESFTAPYRKANELAVVDPIGIEKEIRELEERIDRFETDVDVKLNVSNALTVIDVDM